MHLFYDLPNIQLRLNIFLHRQRAALLPLSYEDAKLHDASFQNVHEHLILLHVVPHRNHEITSARFLKRICPRIVPKDGIIFRDLQNQSNNFQARFVAGIYDIIPDGFLWNTGRCYSRWAKGLAWHKQGQTGTTRDCNPAKRKGPRCILIHRGPLGHALMVEAGGVEPPSENIPRKASTGLGQEQISPPCSPLTGHRAAIPPVQISWKLPAGAKLHQPDAMSPAGRIRRRPV